MNSSSSQGQTIINNEMKKLYCSTLKTLFDNINYYISKKNAYYKEIIEKTKKYIDKIDKLSGDYPLDADKYFILIYKSLTVENYKLAKNLFPHLKILLKNSFITGNTPLNIFNIEFLQLKENDEYIKNGKVIDLIIECLTSIDSIFEDDDIWCFSLECVDEIIKNPNIIYNVKGNSFQKIYNYYLRLFTKLENDKDTIKSIKEKVIFLVNNSIEDLNSYLNFSSPLISPTNKKNHLMQIYNKLGTAECIDNFKTNNYNPLDLYICRQVKTMVDIICIRDAHGDLKFINDENSNTILPIIPKKNVDFTKIKKKDLFQLEIYNEYVYPCGFFGWCNICRKEADHYCIDIRVPVCSYICKNILSNEEKQLQKIRNNLIKDCPEMIKFFCQILSNKTSTAMEKIFSLEVISNIVKNYGNKYKFISHQKNFIKVVKENLSEGLFKTCLSKDPNIFIPSISLFFEVWKIFRVYLKREISFFNNNIFLKILSSTNSSFLQKKTILENFSKCDFLYFIELYANFDCELNEKFTVNSIVTAFSDIVKGRYTRSTHSYSEEENYELVNLALNTLTTMTQSIFEICEKEYILPKSEISTNPSLNSIDISFLTNNNNIHNNHNIMNDNISEFTTETNEKIDSNLKKKYELQKAAEKFNYKINSGIAYLKKVGYLNCSSIDSEAKGIVKFLRYTSSLKKKNIGDFLGENTELSLKTLKYFGESFDFKNMHIIQALRIFLSTFLLPSEGQKIDRVLWSFSSKYYKDNNSLFDNEDCAYTIAYAIMLLQTDLHNPKVKEKMDEESFIKLFDGKCYENLTKEYLGDIYKQILEEPISMTELEEEREKNLSGKIEEKYAREKQRIVNEYAFNKKLNNKNSPYIKLKENDFLEYISQFISSIWEPLTTMYSIVIEESDDSSLYNQGISGLSNWIKIFGLLNLNTQKQTVISFLCSMTNLMHIKPIKKKNILCIKEILFLANNDFRYGKGSWNFILDIINKLCYYTLLNSMPKDVKEEIFKLKMKNYNKKAKNNNNLISYEQILELDKERMKKISKEITQDDFEKIFSKTSSFDSNTLIEFVSSMCEIAKREFQNNSQTRIFFLQKIVEVAEMNLLLRPRFNIANIWKILSEFFVEIGISENIENSSTSIDSLRQLTMKYLEKDESKESHFQAKFFKPFLDISKKTKDKGIQEYIICCIINIIRNNESKIKSGWTVILNIFEEIFKIPDEENLQNQTLDLLQYVSINNYEEISGIFEQFSNCLKLYKTNFPEKLIDIYEHFIPKVENEKNFKILINCFMPLIIHSNDKIRSQSLSDFTNCINKRLKSEKSNLYELGKSQIFWKYLINQLLLPTLSELIKIITSLNYIINNNNLNLVTLNNNQTIDTTNNNITNLDNSFDINSNNNKNGIKSTLIEKKDYCNTLENLLIKIANIFNDFYSNNYKELPMFFELLEKIIFSEDEKIMNTGLECVKFIHGTEKIKNKSYLQNFTIFLITLANKSLEENFSSLNEKDILNLSKSKKNIPKIDMNLSLCFIHFNILSLLDKLLSLNIFHLSDDILNKLLDCLEASIIISNNFNSNFQLRLAITEYNKNVVNPLSSMVISIENNEIINLFRQFQIATKNFYYIAIFLYNKEIDINNKQRYFKRIMDISIKIINYYANIIKESDNLINGADNEKEIKEKEDELSNFILPLCENVFPTIQKIEFYKSERYRDIICKFLFELILCNEQRIREKVKDVLNVVFDKILKTDKQSKNEE